MSGTSLIPVGKPKQQAAAPPPSSSQKAAPLAHSNCFGFLRVAAALMVLVSHMFSISGQQEPGIAPAFTLGGVGLAIFFSVSGYLVTQSWLSDPHVVRFAVRRFLRIFPALIVVVLLSVLALGPLVGTLPNNVYFHDTATWTYLRNILLQPDYLLPGVFGAPHRVAAVNGSLWTLSTEMLMYAMVAMLGVMSVIRRRSLVVLVAAAFTIASIVYKKLSPDPLIFLSIDLQHVIDLAAYFWSGAAFFLLRWHVNFTIPRAIVVYSLCAMLALTPYLVTWTVIAIPYLAIAFGTRQDPWFRIPRWIGDLSYGLYLYAFPVQQVIWERYHDSLTISNMAVLSVLVTSCLAWLSWHVVEHPALRRKPLLRKP